MKPESSNKYEEINPSYLPNKLLNKDSSKTIKIINLKGFFDEIFFEVSYCHNVIIQKTETSNN